MKEISTETHTTTWEATLEGLTHEVSDDDVIESRSVPVDERVESKPRARRPKFDTSHITRAAWLVCEHREVIRGDGKSKDDGPTVLVNSWAFGRCGRPTMHDYTRSEEWMVDTAMGAVDDEDGRPKRVPVGEKLIGKQRVLKHYYRCRECNATRQWGYELLDKRTKNSDEDSTNE